MSVELSMLKFFCDSREIEVMHHAYLEVVDNMERELKLLFNLVHKYYKEFPEKDSIPKDEFLAYYFLKYPRAKDAQTHLDLISEAYKSNLSLDLMKAHLDQMIERAHATKIINRLLPVMEGDQYGILDTVRTDVDTFVGLMHNPPDRLVVPVPCELTVEELIEQEINDAGIPWHLPELTDIIGGVRRKTIGLIYAFVDAGKTSFAMAAVAAFAKYLAETDDIICYCGNEEAAGRLRLRLVQAITNWTRAQIRANGKKAEEIAQDGGIHRVKLFDSITSTDQMEYIAREYRPHVMFVDQATNIKEGIVHGREGVDRLEVLFPWFRGFATNHNLGIVGVAQATGEAEDTKYLKLSDIYGARVAIQAALDYAVGIGRKVNNPIDDALRYLNIPKNKLHDGDGGRMTALFQKYLCEWEVV
jgi:hypothetical protein